ncbi:sensor domain-containing diguanylate cyclase [Butyrivibrio sp. NC2007]|uniref:sensor domain-containing diguanylate cyclase n=1 Tax=Butyrivibrio sp. NC2007 TaxID=1280683 RepID=UPI0018CA02C2|nr:GGDEF domain-containing protein [Butyrivibrio sp. NC2007]
MDKHILRIYTLFLAVACSIVLVYAFNGGAKSRFSMYPKDTQVILTPITDSMDETGTRVLTFDSSEIIAAGGCLSFTSGFNDVRVYSRESIIYESIGVRSTFLRSNGNSWHFVRVPDVNASLTVKLKSVYNNVPTITPEFTAGDYYNLRSSLIAGSAPVLITSILDVLFGLIMIAYSYIIWRITPGKPRIVYIGLTAVLIGLWSAGETNAMVVLLNNRALAGVFAFLILIFIPVPYVMYIRAVLWKNDKFIYRIPICLSLIDFVVVMVLALTGVMDLKQSVIITHLTWALSIIYVVAAAIITLKNHKKEKDSMAIFNAASMLVLIAVAGLEIAYYWTGVRIQNDVWGRVLILGYIVLLANRNIIDSLKDIEKGRRAEYYKKLANTDPITGLANRTAFNHDLKKLSGEKSYSIISMDLNNLKEVNDTKGHLAGDGYIMKAAEIINKVFGKDGKCYRVGGDEFTVIIKKPESDAVVAGLIPQMNEEIAAYNNDNPSEPIAIALGYESSSEETGFDFNDILRLADVKMYENKRWLKAKE